MPSTQIRVHSMTERTDATTSRIEISDVVAWATAANPAAAIGPARSSPAAESVLTDSDN
jgi:hypothetical protein